VIVLKFGGTLLAGPRQRREVAAEVAMVVRRGVRPVVVVSAMGRSGDPYATDTLLEVLLDIGAPVEPRTRDLIMSCGETISTAVMAHLLTTAGVDAVPVTAGHAGVRTTARHGDAEVVGVDPSHLRALLHQGLVPIVPGFQGLDASGHVTTLGRGGSDLTAVALGAALGAPVEIVKDVDGVMTCDPAVLPAARRLARVTYPALSMLTALGSRVVQPRAVRLAWRHRVPLKVRRLGRSVGTEVVMSDAVDLVDESQRSTAGFTCRSGLAAVRVEGGRAPERLALLLAELGVEADCSFVSGGFTMAVLPEAAAGRVRDAAERVELPLAGLVPCARVSVVGADLVRDMAWLQRGVEALGAASVPVVAALSSGFNLCYLVPEPRLGAAVGVLHDLLGRGDTTDGDGLRAHAAPAPW
jgi:aspartate kinase